MNSVYVVSNDLGQVLGIYRTEQECEDNHDDDTWIQEFQHESITFEDFVSLVKHGLN